MWLDSGDDESHVSSAQGQAWVCRSPAFPLLGLHFLCYRNSGLTSLSRASTLPRGPSSLPCPPPGTVPSAYYTCPWDKGRAQRSEANAELQPCLGGLTLRRV